MQAGLLRDFVEVQRATVTVNATNGEQTLTWATAWKGRAKVEYSSGTQTMVNDETVNTYTRKVTIRTKPAFADKLTDLRMVIDGEYYRVLSKDVRHWDMATIFVVKLINQ